MLLKSAKSGVGWFVWDKRYKEWVNVKPSQLPNLPQDAKVRTSRLGTVVVWISGNESDVNCICGSGKWCRECCLGKPVFEVQE